MSPATPNPTRVRRVVRTEVRRTRRRVADDDRMLGLAFLGGLFVLFLCLPVGAVGYALPGGDVSPDTVAAGRAAVVGLVAYTAAMAAFRTVKTTGRPAALPVLLTTTDYRDVLAGVVLADVCYALAVAALPAVAFAGGLLVGSASPLPAIAALLALPLALATGVVLGYVLGLAVKLLVARSATVARHKAVLGSLASFGIPMVYFALVSTDFLVGTGVAAVAAAVPLGWTADLLVLALPGGAGATTPLRALAGLASYAVTLGVLSVLAARLAAALWYVDPARPAGTGRDTALADSPTADRSPVDRWLGALVPAQSRSVTRKCWWRARRSPFVVQFAVAPFFFLVFPAQTALREGSLPPVFALSAVVAASVAAGSAFTLNPVGGEGRVLPAVLTSAIDGRAFVAGLALAGALPGVAVAVALGAGLGVLTGLAPGTLAVLLALAAVLPVAATGIAASLGVFFPNFEEKNVAWNFEAVVPSTLAFVAFYLLFGLVSAPALVGFVLRDGGGSGPPAFLLGAALTAGVAVLLGAAGFRHASRTVASYRME